MLLTVIIVVATGDLSKGVIAGVIISSLLFVAKASSVKINKEITDSKIIFQINGPLFFASLDTFMDHFDFSVANKEIILDFSQTTVWDESAAAVIDKILLKYRDNDNTVDCHGLNTSSKKLMKKLSIS
ncbi:MFS superfamily sulfate permease-like transporter [Pectinatus brassicae]|uniref:MFS superfamily sulfate permease-like transporter n=1 Tax=Pectinatus brassicae TaxID=862415 RepID=A0A840UJB4_9FIRM|nr:STAS domain-containing protein [Pectinatus brassicae]MBB5337079.1 MFS superfamily sulfate permease-like transporter [Pectinatus brassicae]